jgi:large subunit ribosomal protein L21
VTVTARILGHVRGEKLRVFKFKPKRGYKRRTGHRQDLTRIEVLEISAGGPSRPKEKAVFAGGPATPKAKAVRAKPAKAAAAAEPKAAAAAEPKAAAGTEPSAEQEV